MTAYYNEYDAAAAAVLRQQIEEGVIAPGVVDTRSIKEVQPDDLRGFTQCHFFAGGGLWSVALRMAGWRDERPVWTGSCPCQPFSAAGKGAGTDDPRHLWPDFYRLIRAASQSGFGPVAYVGEQVAGAAGYNWFDGVRADLANEGIAARTVDFPACSVDAPHQRNRLYWIAVEHAASLGWGEGRSEPILHGGRPAIASADAPSVTHGDAERARLEGQPRHGDKFGRPKQDRSVAAPDGAGAAGDVGDDIGRGQHQPRLSNERGPKVPFSAGPDGRAPFRPNGTYWSDAEWIVCHDGKARRTKPGLRFLVDGLPGRVDLWRVGGNAIVPQAAAEVVAALMDVLDERAAA